MAAPASLSVVELQQRLSRGDELLLIDVREDQELQLARLPYPVLHLPLSRSTDWLDQLEQQAPPDRPVAVLCHAGVRSWQFSCWLVEQRGYQQVWNIDGGIDAWSRLIDPSLPRY